MPTFPEWWTWDFVLHRTRRNAHGQRGVTEVDLRIMLEKATSYRPNVVEGRFMIDVGRQQLPWVMIVAPDAEARPLVVVTVCEVAK